MYVTQLYEIDILNGLYGHLNEFRIKNGYWHQTDPATSNSIEIWYHTYGYMVCLSNFNGSGRRFGSHQTDPSASRCGCKCQG